jgi:hypothetical protein
VKTGVQAVLKGLKILDSGFRRNDGKKTQANFFPPSGLAGGDLGLRLCRPVISVLLTFKLFKFCKDLCNEFLSVFIRVYLRPIRILFDCGYAALCPLWLNNFPLFIIVG